MRTGSLLCLQSTEGLAPLGAFNQPVHRSFQQIHAALANELGSRYADYFARPDVDSDGHRIGWVASSIGEPRRWVDMSPEEQQRLEPVKREIQAGFDAYRTRLDAAAENSPQNNFGKVLAQAIRVPSPEYLYFIGDQPVLAFWGFKTTTARDGIDPLRLAPGGMTLPTGIAPASVAPVAAVVPAGRRWKWWWWLLLLLLLLPAAPGLMVVAQARDTGRVRVPRNRAARNDAAACTRHATSARHHNHANRAARHGAGHCRARRRDGRRKDAAQW